MVTKNTQPENVELDWGSFKEGSVDVLVHWNITETTGTTEDGQTYPQWQYDEARIRIPLPESAIPLKNGVSNSTKLVLKAGNKIRITADSTDIYAMICPVSGL